jgi:hypothetical protein
MSLSRSFWAEIKSLESLEANSLYPFSKSIRRGKGWVRVLPVFLMRRRACHADGLAIKPGPTQSGIAEGTTKFVGGVILPTVNYWLLALFFLFVLWLGVVLFRNRGSVLRFVAPRFLRLLK